jgi:glyoxylase-like metal-dependent hydrolase (beta-lactamase superfamily II)
VERAWHPGARSGTTPAPFSSTWDWDASTSKCTYEGDGLLAILLAEGLSAADIDLILFTRPHRDHIGWTSYGAGRLTFPNARHLVDRVVWDHWRGPTPMPGGRISRGCQTGVLPCRGSGLRASGLLNRGWLPGLGR